MGRNGTGKWADDSPDLTLKQVLWSLVWGVGMLAVVALPFMFPKYGAGLIVLSLMLGAGVLVAMARPKAPTGVSRWTVLRAWVRDYAAVFFSGAVVFAAMLSLAIGDMIGADRDIAFNVGLCLLAGGVAFGAWVGFRNTRALDPHLGPQVIAAGFEPIHQEGMLWTESLLASGMEWDLGQIFEGEIGGCAIRIAGVDIDRSASLASLPTQRRVAWTQLERNYPRVLVVPKGAHSIAPGLLAGLHHLELELGEFALRFEVYGERRFAASAIVDQRLMAYLLDHGGRRVFELAGSRAFCFDTPRKGRAVAQAQALAGFVHRIPASAAELAGASADRDLGTP